MQIDFKDIVVLQGLYIEIFTALDEDCPDYRIIRPKEKKVARILTKITEDNSKQIQIWNIIEYASWNDNDNSYVPICNKLRKLGYEITGTKHE